LESGSLSSDEFAAWTDNVVPFLHVTTRIPDFPNDGMLGEYGGRGFPTLLFLDAEGEKLTEPSGREVANFASTQKALNDWFDLKARVEKGEKGLDGKMLVAELELGKVDFPTAKARLAKLKKLDDKTKAHIAKLMIDSEIMHLINDAGRDADKMKAAQKRMMEMLKAGAQPGPNAAYPFWNSIMRYSEEIGDAEAFGKAVAWAKETFGSNPRAKDYLAGLDAKLAEMKKAAEENPKP
jgi:hypothetical protein